MVKGCGVSTGLSVMTLPCCFSNTVEVLCRGGEWLGLCSELQSEGCFCLGFSSHLRSSCHSGLISSHSFIANKGSKVTGFRIPHINFVFGPSADCSVRQLEEKLILRVSVSPADSRSRLRDKLLITVQGSRAGRKGAPRSSHQWLYTEGPPWSLAACKPCRRLVLPEQPVPISSGAPC